MTARLKQPGGCSDGQMRVRRRWTTSLLGLAIACGCASEFASEVHAPSTVAPPSPAPSSRQLTYSPQPDTSPRFSSRRCGQPDAGLRRAAKAALDEYARTARLPSSETLEFALRSAGVPYVWVRSWAATGPDLGAVEAALDAWSETLTAGENWRCGVEVASQDGSVHALALVASVLADVSPVPRLGRVGQWLPFVANVHVESTEVAVLALGPSGAPYKLPAQSYAGGQVRAQLPLASPGRWLFQLLSTTAAGPRPVAEVEIFVDAPLPPSPEEQPVPGDDKECAIARCGADRLVFMLNRARASEKLPALQRDARLDALAAEHAQAMRATAQLAHDVGAGDAYIRISPFFPEARLVGENVARAASLAAAHRALWSSPAHRQNLLRREYSVVGVGIAYDEGGEVWVCQLFAARAGGWTID